MVKSGKFEYHHTMISFGRPVVDTPLVPGLGLDDMWQSALQNTLGRVDVPRGLKSTPGASENFRSFDVVHGTTLSTLFRHHSLVGAATL